jgi:hypothetical protein
MTAWLVFRMVISSSSWGMNTRVAEEVPAVLRVLLGTGDTAVGTLWTYPETHDDSVAVPVRCDDSMASWYD